MVELNHTVALSRDRWATAEFVATLLGLPEPTEWGPFAMVRPSNNIWLLFVQADGEIPWQHFAFLVSEQEFDEIFDRIKERGLPYWADPSHEHAGKINTLDGGRGLYFDDPDGHNLEILTCEYGEEERPPDHGDTSR